MGVCSFQEAWKGPYPWAYAVAGYPNKARCLYCPGKQIDVKCGVQALKRHQSSGTHSSAFAAGRGHRDIQNNVNAETEAQMGKTRATVLHCLKLVLDGNSLRSSDCASRDRKFYTKAFPDSKFAAINCGKTKASYIINFALAPFVKKRIQTEMMETPFALHVDESTYHGKVRLEFWAVHFLHSERKVRYLETIELQTDIDLKAFLESREERSLNELKLVSAQAVFDATMTIFNKFLLEPLNLVHVMTDNCSTMRGSIDGFLTKMKSVCTNIVDIDGCSSHQGNLLSKDMIKEFDFLAKIVQFVEQLSNFIENKPKVRSILKQTCGFLKIKSLPDYSETRFLNLYLVIESLVTQFPVVRKLVALDRSNTLLKELLQTKNLLINLDQFAVHLKPIYDLTKATQSFKGSVYQLLLLVLELTSKLLSRLGHCVPIVPHSYYRKLYSSQNIPLEFTAASNNLNYSNIPEIFRELNSLEDKEVQAIAKQWNDFNAFLLKRLLKRFGKFLSSILVRKTYVLYQNSINFDEKTIHCIKDLGL